MTTVLITGASSGIGKELAIICAKNGHDLVLVARREERLRELADSLSAQTTIIAKDLTEPDAPRDIFEVLSEKEIHIDFLINNAGIGSNGAFQELDTARELAQIQLNVCALVNLTSLFLPAMVKNGNGRVLNIASTAAFQTGPFMAVYYATKAFVLSFSEALSYELKGTGVRVTAHCPGATATEFAKTAGNDTSLLFKLSVADVQTVAAHAYRHMMLGTPVAIPGLLNRMGAWSVRFTPRFVLRWFTGKLNR